MQSNGKRKLGIALGNTLRHAGAKEHEKHVELWVKAKNKERALRRLRLFARMAGRVLVWHARAAESTYAPGGRGFAVARASFEAQKGVVSV